MLHGSQLHGHGRACESTLGTSSCRGAWRSGQAFPRRGKSSGRECPLRVRHRAARRGGESHSRLGLLQCPLYCRKRQPWRKQREALTAIVSTMQCASAARDELRFAHVCVLAKPMGRSRGMGGVFASRTTAEAELIWRRAEACRGVEVYPPSGWHEPHGNVCEKRHQG